MGDSYTGRPSQDEIRELLSAGRGLYEILQVNRRSTHDEIKKKYRELAKKYHPDKVGQKEAEKMLDINKAYRILSNQRYRYLYDNYEIGKQQYQQQHQHQHQQRNQSTNHDDDDQHHHGGVEEDIKIQEIVHLLGSVMVQYLVTPFKVISVVCQVTRPYSSPWRTFTRLRNGTATTVNVAASATATASGVQSSTVKTSIGGGASGGFKRLWRGTGTASLLTMVADQISNHLLGKMSQYIQDNRLIVSNTMEAIYSKLIRSIVEYPFEIVSTTIMTDEKLTTPTLVISKLLKRGMSNVFSGLTTYIVVQGLSDFVEKSIERLDKSIRDRYIMNSNSLYLRYSNWLLSSTLVKTILYTMVMTPFHVICYQRQLQALLPADSQVGSLQLLLRIFSSGGGFLQSWKQLYAGFVPLTIYLAIYDTITAFDKNYYN